MKQVLIRHGKAVLEEVPAPRLEAGRVLVKVNHSCISIGTELSGISGSGKPLWKRALEDPKKIGGALEMAAARGIGQTVRVIREGAEAATATGYSAAGRVIAVGEGIEGFVPGDRVACGGGQYAYHAEYISVPENLTAAIPAPVDFAAASTATLGAVALQGVRRAMPTLGETFVVVGLGILGQLTAQLLTANGCRVVGIDPRPQRVQRAIDLGMDLGFSADGGNAVKRVLQFSGGIGVDGVIITAASSDPDLLTGAMRYCRRKGRAVLVGDVPIRFERGDIYQKEIDFFISTSYGPGRYDQRYEEHGMDYPPAYVRWTENRNMLEYLRLVSDGQVRVDVLIDRVFPLQEVGDAYTALQSGDTSPLMVLLAYPEEPAGIFPSTSIATPDITNARPVDGRIRIALIGAGEFARATHLPNLRELGGDFLLHAVVSRSGHNAQSVARQYGATHASTDVEAVLNDDGVDAVLIATRHHLHADLTLRALAAGKHVLVEKPLALSIEELTGIEESFAGRQRAPVLLTGFNRRFSRHLRPILDLVRERAGPFIANYRMNAGHLPSDHWVHGSEGGGRNIGEACHIYDLFTALAGSEIRSVEVLTIVPSSGHFRRDDNFIATLGFADGSAATLTYTALGNASHPKERMELYCDGAVAELDDYRRLRLDGVESRGARSTNPDKGHKEELQAFAASIRGETGWPIPLWQQLQAMRTAFSVQDRIGGKTECSSGNSPDDWSRPPQVDGCCDR